MMKLRDNMVTIAMFGTGYVGLTTGVCLAELGNTIICVDIDAQKINNLKKGILPIYEPGLDKLLEKNLDKIEFTTDGAQAIKNADVIFIAVGTPSQSDGSANLDYVRNVAKIIGKNIESYKVIVDKSTVPVGTADMVRDVISTYYSGDFDVASNPEFLKEGSAVDDFLNPDRVCIGVASKKAKSIMLDVYGNMPDDKIMVTDVKSAEMIKYASNTFLALSISFVNELTQIYPNHNIRHVTAQMKETINQKGFFNIGLGFGGSCFPKDVKEFLHTFNVNGIESEILDKIITVNEKQKTRFVPVIKDKLGNLENKKIALLGLAFKPNTDDMREAPSLALISQLKSLGAQIIAYDPIAMTEAKHYLNDSIEFSSNSLETVDGADALIIVTEWEEFKQLKPEEIESRLSNPLICDGRNVFSEDAFSQVTYIGVGSGKQKMTDEELTVVFNSFFNTTALYKDALHQLASKVSANIEDVIHGMMLDSRIGPNVFRE